MGMLTTHIQLSWKQNFSLLCSETVKGTKSAKDSKDKDNSSDQGQFSSQSSNKSREISHYKIIHCPSYMKLLTWLSQQQKQTKVRTSSIFVMVLVCYHCFNFLSAPDSHPASSSGCYSAPHHRALTTENVLSALHVPLILSLHWWIWPGARRLSFKQIHIGVIERAGALVG